MTRAGFYPFLSWLLLLAHEAAAQNVFVTAGEHGTFTRVFLDAPSGTAWDLERIDGGYSVSPNQPVSGFNLSRAFERISDVRIGAISSQEGNLIVTLNCDCVADAQDWGNGDVVIDIKDSPANDPNELQTRQLDIAAASQDQSQKGEYSWTAQFEDWGIQSSRARATPPPDPTLPIEMDAPSANSSFARRIMKSGEQLLLDDFGALPIDASGSVRSFSNQVVSLPTPQTDKGPSATASELRADLLRQLQRATAQGIIDFPQEKRKDIVRTTPEKASLPDTHSDAETGAIAERPKALDTRQIVVSTAPDIALSDAANDLLAQTTSTACLPSDWLDASQWSANPPEHGLSGLRADLVGEFDKPRPDAVIRLVRQYLYLGFGLEARRLIETFPVDHDQTQLVLELAHHLDGGVPLGTGLLRSQIGCSPQATLWALIAAPDAVHDPEMDTRHMLAAFSDFPVHLRNLLGPALAETLADAGRLDDAIAVRNLLERSTGAHQESVQMIEAEIELAKGETENAKAHLDAVIAGDSSEAARAMVKLINENRRLGLPVDPQLASAADALAVEYRGTELGRELTEAAIRAFSISGQPQITFERIHDAQAAAALSDATIHALQIEAFHDAALNADDAGFVIISHKESFPAPQTNQQDLPLPELSARLAMANRLTGLGFADKAYDILAPAAHVQNDETRLAAARVLASQGDFGQALQQLQGLEDATSTELRLNALVRSKRYTEAIPLLEEMGRISDAVQLAWIAGDLVRIRRMDDRPISGLASARERPEVTNILEHPKFEPLELGRQMISLSQSMRSEIMAFLD